jgi:hypothetical protein
MKQRIAKTLEEAIEQETEDLSALVLEYSKRIRELVDAVKVGPQAGEAALARLADMVNTDRFERVGTYRECVGWDEYCKLLMDWGAEFNWDCHVRRVSQCPGYVLLELTEFGEYVPKKEMDIVCSLSIYEFGDNGKIDHLDVYLQRENKPAPPGSWGDAEQ